MNHELLLLQRPGQVLCSILLQWHPSCHSAEAIHRQKKEIKHYHIVSSRYTLRYACLRQAKGIYFDANRQEKPATALLHAIMVRRPVYISEDRYELCCSCCLHIRTMK